MGVEFLDRTLASTKSTNLAQSAQAVGPDWRLAV